MNYELFTASQRDANSVYDEARRVYKSRCRDNLAQAANSRTWWCTPKESVCGTDYRVLNTPFDEIGRCSGNKSSIKG